MRALLRWITLMSFLLSAQSVFAGNSAEEAFELGMARFDQGDYELAIPHLNEAIELDPKLSDAYKYLGRTLMKLERWAQAVERLTHAYDLMPEAKKNLFWTELWDSVVQAFIALLDGGELERALIVLDDAWQLLGHDTHDRQKLIAVLVVYEGKLASEGRLDEALSILNDDTPASPELLAL